MAIKIAHASISENGSVKNGVAGDQTGKEVCIRTWYNKPWQYVIRFKDSNMREKVAVAMERACNNNNIGYDQNQRNTLLTKARSVGYDPSKVTSKCETDCSALVTLACIYAGILESSLFISGNSATTTTLRSRLVKTGKVEVFNSSKYIASDNYLLRGDILLREGSHVAVAIENGSKAVVASTPTTSTTTSSTYTKTQFIKDIQSAIGVMSDGIVGSKTLGALITVSKSKNNKHKVVKPLQKYLNVIGYDCGTADGIFGNNTHKAVISFQTKYKLSADGIVGKNTWKKLFDI